MTTKETIKSSIRDEVRDVSKLAHNKSENGLYENEQRIQMQQVWHGMAWQRRARERRGDSRGEGEKRTDVKQKEVIVVPPIPEATPAPPATLHSAMASKYGINTRQGGGQGDLLPPTSRFAKRKNSLDPSSAAAAAAAAAQLYVDVSFCVWFCWWFFWVVSDIVFSSQINHSRSGGMRHNRSANDLAAAESGSFRYATKQNITKKNKQKTK